MSLPAMIVVAAEMASLPVAMVGDGIPLAATDLVYPVGLTLESAQRLVFVGWPS